MCCAAAQTTVHGPPDRLETGDERFSFVFLDVTYTVPLFGTERVQIRGPGWPNGRWSFGRKQKETGAAFAVDGNLTFIREERRRLRERLLSAARDGKLRYNNGALIDVFVADGCCAATAIELDGLDFDA